MRLWPDGVRSEGRLRTGLLPGSSDIRWSIHPEEARQQSDVHLLGHGLPACRVTLQRIHQGIRREFQESGNPDDILRKAGNKHQNLLQSLHPADTDGSGFHPEQKEYPHIRIKLQKALPSHEN